MSPEVIYNGQKVEPNDEQEITLPTNPTVITSAQLKKLRQELVSEQTQKPLKDKIPVLK